MSYELVLLPNAEEEYQEAYNWYEAQAAGLGSDFEGMVDECLSRLSKSPEANSFSGKSYRRAAVNKFPYIVIYRLDKKAGKVLVYAIFHTSRRPGKKYRKL